MDWKDGWKELWNKIRQKELEELSEEDGRWLKLLAEIVIDHAFAEQTH